MSYIMRLNYLTVLFFALCTSLCFVPFAPLQAQPPSGSSFKEKSDPEAKSILDKVRRKYQAFANLQADFSLQIELEGEVETQTGRLYQRADRYKVEMRDHAVYCNGATVWFHLKNDNEVHISNPTKDFNEGFMSPSQLLSLYEEEKNFICAYLGQTTLDGKAVRQIEFKPTNAAASEFSKFRLSIDASDLVYQIIAFGKDGMRYTLKMTKTTAGTYLDDSFFTFDVKKFPSIYVEDLRY